MLSVQENDALTRVGKGTLMGELMRRYWHPIAAAGELEERPTKQIRLLGEDLVLYKDRSGTIGLIDRLCAHRRVDLSYGIPEENGLRCMYHGWMYDETGQCIEQPFEETVHPDGRFKDKVKIAGYPVKVAAGLVFAYLGPQPTPELPMWEPLTWDNAVRDIAVSHLDCNWLQCQENSLDPVHVEWMHVYFGRYSQEGNNWSGPSALLELPGHQKIGFDEFEYGIVKRRILEGETEADEDWAVGHPVVFPNYLKSGSVSTPAFQIRVPMDDENTAYWWYRCFTKESGVPIKPQSPDEIPFYTAPVPQLDQTGLPQWDILDNNSGQDIVAWITQGAITDRSHENLGRSDKGVVLYRKMLEDALQAVEKGEDPKNVFRDPGINRIDLAVETAKLKGRAGSVLKGPRSGNTTKYSPILKEMDTAAN